MGWTRLGADGMLEGMLTIIRQDAVEWDLVNWGRSGSYCVCLLEGRHDRQRGKERTTIEGKTPNMLILLLDEDQHNSNPF